MKVAVLLSGGLDSTTALHWALRHHQVVCALSFDYGSNHAARELACARWLLRKLFDVSRNDKAVVGSAFSTGSCGNKCRKVIGINGV